MTTLDAQFQSAVADSTRLAQRPDNQSLLKLYALYKQSTEGDVTGKRPGFTDTVGRMKYDAWSELKGTDTAVAMQQYIDLVVSLKA